MNERSPLYWKTWAIAGPSLLAFALLLMLRGLVWPGVVALIAGPVLFFGLWLLSRYSNTAGRLTTPTIEDLDKSTHFWERSGPHPSSERSFGP